MPTLFPFCKTRRLTKHLRSRTIPFLSVTVYAGTVFTLRDGTRPNPFPLKAVQVAIDRLPDNKPPNPMMLSVFIVAFQPADANASQPVAVTFPTRSHGHSMTMALMTLTPRAERWSHTVLAPCRMTVGA